MRKIRTDDDPVLIEVIQRLHETLGDNVERIILFGSRARGDAHEDSDYDILLLVKKHPKVLENQLNDITYEILDHFGKLAMLFAFESSAYESSKIEPLFLSIKREGILL